MKQNQPQNLWGPVMRAIREAPGKVYLENVQDLVNRWKEPGSPAIPVEDAESIENLPGRPDEKTAGREPFLFTDGARAVYTIPGRRQTLDALLAPFGFSFNTYLYTEALDGAPQASGDPARAVKIDGKTREVEIDLGLLAADGPAVVRDFDLEEALLEACRREGLLSAEGSWAVPFDSLRIARFYAAGVLFLGSTRLAFRQEARDTPLFLRGMELGGATFQGDLIVQNLRFSFDLGRERRVDFRNARFFASALFRDILVGGDAGDAEFSFEDARFSGRLEFANVLFGNASLNCFQTVLGPYLTSRELPKDERGGDHTLLLKNCSFSGSGELLCEGMQIAHGTIRLDNVENLPLASLTPDCLTLDYQSGKTLRTDCALELIHTVIREPLFIKNFSEVHFEGVTNYGHIVSEGEWAPLPRKTGKNAPYLPRELRRGKRALNPLLEALYVYGFDGKGDAGFPQKLCAQKEDAFNMLRLDFGSQGLYDEEDQAFLFYMHFKPYGDASGGRARCLWKRGLYRLLYAVGDYGLNPGKVLKNYLLVALIFSLFYFAGLCLDGAFFSFSSLPRDGSFPVLLKLGQSVLYSLQCVSPFPAQCDTASPLCALLAAFENFWGTFLLGYFSFAIVKRTLRS